MAISPKNRFRFIDYEKAIDFVITSAVMKTLKRQEIVELYVRTLENIHTRNTTILKLFKNSKKITIAIAYLEVFKKLDRENVGISINIDEYKYFGYTTMATCFGEGVYYDYLAKIGIAQKECLQFPVSNLHRLDFSLYSQLGYPLHFGGDSLYVPFPSYHTAQQGHYGVPHGYQSLHYRKKRQAEAAGETAAAAVPQQAASPFFDRYYLLDSVNKIMAALSNYTCTLNKLNVIDEYMNININHLTEQYTSLPISDGFKQDLIDGIYYCRDLTYCLPLHNTRSPLPLNLQRLLMAMECEKETRTNACFKEDLRKNVGEFDLSLFPEDDDQESVLNKLSAIITGVDSLNELEIL
ncbi:uncharacterized protein [Palaemon carinicauda]|uniref:uncharacterized protein n=1 Tax=Palaemon carinicauda TaxID=392227 RepID=UPI0035B5EE77